LHLELKMAVAKHAAMLDLLRPDVKVVDGSRGCEVKLKELKLTGTT
jgi:hypothetical protein